LVRTISVWFVVVYKSAEEKLQTALASPSMHMVARTLPPPCSASGHVGGRRAPPGMTCFFLRRRCRWGAVRSVDRIGLYMVAMTFAILIPDVTKSDWKTNKWCSKPINIRNAPNQRTSPELILFPTNQYSRYIISSGKIKETLLCFISIYNLQYRWHILDNS
jgi:hypothetical protein